MSKKIIALALAAVMLSAMAINVFAELTAEQKNAISHRGKAIEKFAEFLKSI